MCIRDSFGSDTKQFWHKTILTQNDSDITLFWHKTFWHLLVLTQCKIGNFGQFLDSETKRFWHNDAPPLNVTYFFQLIFVVASDDPKWCKEHLSGLPHKLTKHSQHKKDISIHFTQDFYKSAPVNVIHFDLAVLAGCNHSIFDYGTYGFLGAYLASELASYYRVILYIPIYIHFTKGFYNISPSTSSTLT